VCVDCGNGGGLRRGGQNDDRHRNSNGRSEKGEEPWGKAEGCFSDSSVGGSSVIILISKNKHR